VEGSGGPFLLDAGFGDGCWTDFEVGGVEWIVWTGSAVFVVLGAF